MSLAPISDAGTLSKANKPELIAGIWAQHGKFITVALGLLVILGANFYLRRNLERTNLPDYPMLQAYRPIEAWKLWLPLDWGEATGNPQCEGIVHWCTTG